MLTLLIIGILALTIKMIWLAIKFSWGITKAVLFVIALPIVLIGLAISGIVVLAIPLLLIFLAGAFLIPVLKRV